MLIRPAPGSCRGERFLVLKSARLVQPGMASQPFQVASKSKPRVSDLLMYDQKVKRDLAVMTTVKLHHPTSSNDDKNRTSAVYVLKLLSLTS